MTIDRISRRSALQLAAVTTAAGVLAPNYAISQETGADTGAPTPGADICVITPATTEGPFYFDPGLERSDITDGQLGVPVTVRLQVVDSACRPIGRARVDIWHANARGVYSGYSAQTGGANATGETFLRGTQFTDANGFVEFQTIYPGWYPGRTPHIHFKVFPEEGSVLTGQMFLPDALSQFIYQHARPYRVRGHDRDVFNTNDGVAGQAGRTSFAYVKELDGRYLVTMTIGVGPSM